nr:MAG TPA: hypothetical protein [Caudoviricetes sp.]
MQVTHYNLIIFTQYHCFFPTCSLHPLRWRRANTFNALLKKGKQFNALPK